MQKFYFITFWLEKNFKCTDSFARDKFASDNLHTYSNINATYPTIINALVGEFE